MRHEAEPQDLTWRNRKHTQNLVTILDLVPYHAIPEPICHCHYEP